MAVHLSSFAQELIYFFNEHNHRDPIVMKCLEARPTTHERKMVYLGTVDCRQLNKEKNYLYAQYPGAGELSSTPFDRILHRLPQSSSAPSSFQQTKQDSSADDRTACRLDALFSDSSIKKYFFRKDYHLLWTVNFLYGDYNVHFVSFVFYTTTKRLLSFDSGYNLYLPGQQVVVPGVMTALTQSKLFPNRVRHDGHRSFGLCPQFHYDEHFGIQYDGADPTLPSRPADAFCQSWSLFFLLEYIYHKGNLSFYEHWCKIDPLSRETFIIHRFFIPVFLLFPALWLAFRRAIHHLEMTTGSLRRQLLTDSPERKTHPHTSLSFWYDRFLARNEKKREPPVPSARQPKRRG